MKLGDDCGIFLLKSVVSKFYLSVLQFGSIKKNVGQELSKKRSKKDLSCTYL